MDANIAAASSPVDEPLYDETEGQDYEAYYRDLGDCLSSDAEDEYNGSAEYAPANKKLREQGRSSPVPDGLIVVDLEDEVMSPEEFESLYAIDPNAGGDGTDEKHSSSFSEDAVVVDQQTDADVSKVVDEIGDINPEDMALFMGQGALS